MIRNVFALDVRLMALAGGVTGGEGKGKPAWCLFYLMLTPKAHEPCQVLFANTSSSSTSYALKTKGFCFAMYRCTTVGLLFRRYSALCVFLSSRTRKWSMIERRHVNVNPVLFPPVKVCGIFLGRKAWEREL